jgi:hypothetical protein
VGAKAAIGTIIPLVSIFGAVLLFMLWRRRKARKASKAAKWMDSIEPKSGNHPNAPVTSADPKFSDSTSPIAAAGASQRMNGASNETPEWNVEMDALETERSLAYKLVPGRDPIDTMNDKAITASELGGFSKQKRKPLPSYELEGHDKGAELPGGDASARYELPS